jgi:type IV fimbrial biogenesis protein FimT
MDLLDHLLDHQQGRGVLMRFVARLAGASFPLQRGMSLIELMVGISIIAMLMVFAAPSFSDWIQNTRIRSMADSIQNGLQFARTEAVRRNVPVRFQLTTTLDNSCALSLNGPQWVVNLDATTGTSPASLCATAINDSTTPYVLQVSPTGSVSSNASMTASPTSIVTFNSLGRQMGSTNPSTTVGRLSVDVASSRGTCAAAGGTLRCLRVVVEPAGQIRMCDPNLTVNAANQDMACP